MRNTASPDGLYKTAGEADDVAKLGNAAKANAPDNAGPDWKSRRSFQDGDSGLKDHASRHSDLSPQDYLAKGQLNVTQGRMLKGGGKYPDVNYWVRKIGDDQYSLTIVDKSGKILSIDTWQHGCVPMSKADILNGLKKSGVTPPQGFWEKLLCPKGE